VAVGLCGGIADHSSKKIRRRHQINAPNPNLRVLSSFLLVAQQCGGASAMQAESCTRRKCPTPVSHDWALKFFEIVNLIF